MPTKKQLFIWWRQLHIINVIKLDGNSPNRPQQWLDTRQISWDPLPTTCMSLRTLLHLQSTVWRRILNLKLDGYQMVLFLSHLALDAVSYASILSYISLSIHERIIIRLNLLSVGVVLIWLEIPPARLSLLCLNNSNLDVFNIDIIAISETWLQPKHEVNCFP